MNNFRFGIIIPSYQDPRIIHSLRSIVKKDSNLLARIYVIDGGSSGQIIQEIKKNLRDTDFLITEEDQGIFDALNKGLDIVSEDYVGWLGSDDKYSEDFSFEEVKDLFSSSIDAIVYDTSFVSKGKVKRKSKARSLRMIRLGFHNPHFSTFLRASSLHNLRFDLSYGNLADIFFFLNFFSKPNIEIRSIRKVACIMSLGGVSNNNFLQIIKNNVNIFFFLFKERGLIFAFIFTFNKILSKFV